ncbi:MAG: DEAD/DEAH box helicase [Actinomycetota bacterium]|nr:DEAD/DEAH box helicase [Actinomycetota bacterium]
MPTGGPTGPELYRWQLDALTSWVRCGRRGVIEAVTGSGKTDVALAAIVDARRRGRFVLVLVPTRILMDQWYGRLVAALPDARIGRLGDSGRDQPASCDVLVATRHSAASHRPAPPGEGPGLLVADECHGLGGGVLRRALLTSYGERLGLTATLERSDDAVTDLLLPYFGGICHRYGFEEAIADGVCARPRVAFVGVRLAEEERKEYVATEQRLVDARHHLRGVPGMPLTPFGDFIAAVSHLAEHDGGADGRAARDYLDVFSARRQIVAQSSAKYELLGQLAPAIRDAEGALLFTETVRGANHAVNRLDPFVDIEPITGSTARRERKEILGDLRGRRLDAIAAPRVLDEGIDVPDADLGVVISASRTRRQMIQRMGRILRRKGPGGRARFVIMFALDTLEDPAHRVDRDGFVEEIERISEASGTFDAGRFEELDAFLAPAGPEVVPEPERLGHLEAVLTDVRTRLRGRSGGPAEPSDAKVVRALADEVGVETAYAHLRFARHGDPALGAVAEQELADRLPEPGPDAAPYVEIELAVLPEISAPKARPKRLSTGESPLAIRAVADGFRLTCTGCGRSSQPVRFRWQVHEQTVACCCE